MVETIWNLGPHAYKQWSKKKLRLKFKKRSARPI